jgi:hypothetical protein
MRLYDRAVTGTLPFHPARPGRAVVCMDELRRESGTRGAIKAILHLSTESALFSAEILRNFAANN